MICLVSIESRIAADHPLRAIKTLADAALQRLSDSFDAMYADSGRPSIPPERLLKSLLLIALHSVRSERQFCEQLEYNLLYRWFLCPVPEPLPGPVGHGQGHGQGASATKARN